MPKTLVYLTPQQIDPSRLLAPPPKDGSTAQQEEMAAVKRLIHSRTPERYAQAKWDAQHEDVSPFAATIGPEFDLAKLPATAKLLESVLHDQSVAASTAKDYFHRKFPVTAEMPQAYSEQRMDLRRARPQAGKPSASLLPQWTCDTRLLRGCGASRPHSREITRHYDPRG